MHTGLTRRHQADYRRTAHRSGLSRGGMPADTTTSALVAIVLALLQPTADGLQLRLAEPDKRLLEHHERSHREAVIVLAFAQLTPAPGAVPARSAAWLPFCLVSVFDLHLFLWRSRGTASRERVEI